jgi:hypothetical protein
MAARASASLSQVVLGAAEVLVLGYDHEREQAVEQRGGEQYHGRREHCGGRLVDDSAQHRAPSSALSGRGHPADEDRDN